MSFAHEGYATRDPSSERDPGLDHDPGIGLRHLHFHIVEGEAAAPVRLILEHSFDPTL